MKIKKVYEKLHENATNFSKLIEYTFFSNLDEFENVHYKSDDGENFTFYIYFSSIYKETIDQIKKFNDFMGFDTDGYCFLPKNNIIFEEFRLNNNLIIKYLEKLNQLDTTKKYNL